MHLTQLGEYCISRFVNESMRKTSREIYFFIICGLLTACQIAAPPKQFDANAIVEKVAEPKPVSDKDNSSLNVKKGLLVSISVDGKISLTNEITGKTEDIGTTQNTQMLITRLKTMLSERKKNASEEQTENETTVYVRAPRSLSYEEVVSVVEAAKAAGAKPIGLQISD
ncbi:MAG: biopolymer transporter ExbD [Pyrinomonadaceae bacterium]